jgi:hypothetical protein
MSRLRLSLPLLLCLCSCAYVGALQTWNPGRAATDAEHDIAAGNIRFAYIGGYASHAPGLPEGSYRIVIRYPRFEVGPQGCIQDNGSDVRADYARRYNARMWTYVSSHAHHLTNRMKPTAPLRNKFSMFATTPCRGLSLSR